MTGGSGYIAHSLVPRLLQEGVEVLRFRASGRRTPDPMAGVEDREGDFSSPDDWARALEGVDTVFHLAGQTSVYVANEDPVADLSINILPMLRLLEAGRHSDSRPFILFASTVTVHGLPDRLPVDESFPTLSLSLYERHKLVCEEYLDHYRRSGWIRGASLRLANVYGPGPKSVPSDRGVMNLMVRRAVAGEALTQYGEASFVRDYVHVRDVAEAFLAASTHRDHLNLGAYLIGTGTGTVFSEALQRVADRAVARTGRAAPIRKVPPPPGQSPIETRNFVADTSAFARDAGWHASIDLEEGIRELVELFYQATEPRTAET